MRSTRRLRQTQAEWRDKMAVEGFQRSRANLIITTNSPEGVSAEAETRLLDALESFGEPFSGTYEEAVSLVMSTIKSQPMAQSLPILNPSVPSPDAPQGTLEDRLLAGAKPVTAEPQGTAEEQLLQAEAEDAGAPTPTAWEHTKAGAAAITRGLAVPTAGAVLGAGFAVPFLGPPAVAAGALAATLSIPVTMLWNWLTGRNDKSFAENVGDLLSKIGVPRSETVAAELLEGSVRSGATVVAVMPVLAEIAGAIGATTASARATKLLVDAGTKVGPGAQAPLGSTGAAQQFLQTAATARPGPVFAGEIAEEYGGRVTGPSARAGAEAIGIENPVALDTIESVSGLLGSMFFGGLAEGGLELLSRFNDITSPSNLRGRNPETDLGPEPLTRSEINQDNFMSTQRGQMLQSITNDMMGGTGEIPRQRFWQNQQRLKNMLGEYGIEVDDLGGLPNYGPELLERFLSTRKQLLTENVDLRDFIKGQMPTDDVVPVPSAVLHLEAEITRLAKRTDDSGVQLHLKAIGWLESIRNKDFNTLHDTNRAIRDELGSTANEVIRTEGKQIVDEMYRRVSSDMEGYVRKNSGGILADDWKLANDNLASLARDFNDEALKGIIEQGKLNPDNINSDIIMRRINSSDRSDVEKVFRSMDEEGQMIMRQAVLVNIAQSQDFNHLSPNLFSHRVAENSEALGVVLTDNQRQLIAGEKAWYDQTYRAEEISTGIAVGPKGLPISAVGGGGTAISAGVRKFGPLALLFSVGTAGALGKLARYAEKWPHIKQLFVELADLTPGSDSSVRLSRIIGHALEQAIQEDEMSPRVNELLEPRDLPEGFLPPPREE